ncbi:hypothetical protein Arub01_10980 [Actinomadura rubrobrunea]|uniref:Tat pathway signal sequence domain protein n=1 Tax=Actinomadura rubrobrunea TaxID=115335 RepID=A0A9W6UTK6_9ACTN|nr:hypothetical protein [Actinomadura rubrobrunea]GLW62854.1 hypothetical protein Arub01_10980 [Actinomadura rubrobrunea]
MVHLRRTAVLGVATLAALALAVPSASAQTTTVRKGSATADPYSGRVQASLLGVATVSTSLGTGSCNESTMTGSIQSDGSGLTIDSASFSNNGGPCSGSTSATITPENFPWSGGSATYDSAHTGGRDAAVTIANFRVRAVVNILGGITCIYGGNLTANGFNPDNPNRGDTSVAEAQVGVRNATVNKISNGSSFLCPSTATVSANYKLLGESSPGSGVYDQTLYVTE